MGRINKANRAEKIVSGKRDREMQRLMVAGNTRRQVIRHSKGGGLGVGGGRKGRQGQPTWT